MEDKTKHLQAVETIRRKLLGRTLTYKEIYNLMDEIAHERLGDVLTAYFVAAGFKEGFSAQELYYLTKAVVETGTHLKFDGVVADKHSVGGLPGARASMIVVPILAAAGFKIPKTSSRAITSPAGTADVMEMFAPVTLTPEQITQVVNEVGGCVVWGGHLGIAPADDIIIKVEEPLAFESFDKVIISIMAKKVAVGANHVIFDLPYGRTMKIKYKKDAQVIANKFHALAEHFNMKILTDINETHEPSGNGVGPYLEALDVLKVLEQTIDRPLDLEKRAIRLAATLLDLCYKTTKEKKVGEVEAKRILANGEAQKKFLQIVKAQGGNDQVNSQNFKSKAGALQIHSQRSGTIVDINNLNLSAVAKILGAPKDQFAGMYLHKRINEKVSNKERIMTLYSTKPYHLQEAEATLKNFPIYSIE